MTISSRIFALLKEQGKTQTALATHIGIRVATVSAWKAQNTDPSANLLEKIAEFFDVSVDYLVTGKEYAPSPSQTVNQGIFGDRNHNNTVTINGNAPLEVSEIEGELLKVCASLDIRRKNALLTYAYKLENEMSEV